MRTLILFDLPSVEYKDQVNYRKFRKFLINEGFIMLQESVYCKIMMNQEQNKLLLNRIRNRSPRKGIIQVLTITEKQYSMMEYIIGSSQSKIIDNAERLIVLWKYI